MHRVEPFLDPQQVEPRTSSGHHAERLPLHLSGECQLLQVVEAGRPLDVGKGFGALYLRPLEHLPRHQRPPKHAHEFDQLMPDATIQPDQLAVDVVECFRRRRVRAHEEGSGATDECFHVAVALREVRIQVLQEPALAASS